MSFKLSIKRRFNKTLRVLLRKKEVGIHGIMVPLELVRYEQAFKELDRGTYEDAEDALIARHFKPGGTVVELGASLGIISAVIGRTAPARLVCVEALPKLAAAVRGMLARRRSTILAEEKIEGPFHLVCDIEGMEAVLFLDDAGALAKCAGLILEAHPTEYKGRKFGPDDIFQLCKSLGFDLVERRRNAAYFKRKGG